MPNIKRIERMEKALDACSAAVQNLAKAANAYAQTQAELKALSAYYSSEDWMQDFADDEGGLLPGDLKRGVLSEDAVYDLLCDNAQLLAMLREILDNEKTAPDEV